MAVLLTFLWVANTCCLVFKVVAKIAYLVAIVVGHVTAQLPPIVRFMTKQNYIWSKAFTMPLTIWHCVLSCEKKNYFSENSLLFQEITFRWKLFATYIFNGQMGFSGGKFATCYC